MCTVTFIAQDGKVFITSNRDERIDRKSATFPHSIQSGDESILFAKDGEAGGTWMAVKSDGFIAVLLNGGFENHIPLPPYRRSRGLILLDVLKAENPFDVLTAIELEGIEPFTLILYAEGCLIETRWDGIQKHRQDQDPRQNHLWASATLYSREIIEAKKKSFEYWQKEQEPGEQSIIDFHANSGNGKLASNILEGQKLKTVSITQISLNETEASIKHIDLKTESPVSVSERVKLNRQGKLC